MPTEDGQPDIISISTDAQGRTVVVDTEGTTVLPPTPTLFGQSGTFAVNVNWPGGYAEIRWSSEDDSGNNRSLVHINLFAHTNGGFTTYGNGNFLMRGNGDSWSGWYTAIGGDWTHVAGRDVWVGHDASGYGQCEVGVAEGRVWDTSFSACWGTAIAVYTNYTVLPYAPYNLSIRPGSVKTTSFGVDYARSSWDYVDYDHAHWATDPGFTNIVWNDTTAQGYTNPEGRPGGPLALTPGTTYYVRVYSHTGAGFGPASATISQTTLPAVAPGMVVATSPSGTQATLTFTAPGGVSGVTKYTWERRATGTTTPVTTEDSTTAITTVSGLTPGNSYDWRASAWISAYQSPWTEWTTLVQNKPNTNPGDYFDGATTDVNDLDYQWGLTGAGTANASISTAVAVVPEGWAVGITNGAATLYRVTAGLFSEFAARVVWTADTAATGQRFGQMAAAPYWSDVTSPATYVGSISCYLSRSQRVAAELTWLNAAGAVISRTVGTATDTPANTWMRLVAAGAAPALAEFAVVSLIDVSGAGWSTWKGGDVITLDGAMISLSEQFPYFDGDTLIDGTYVYEWEGVAHKSVSTRTPIALADTGALTTPFTVQGLGAQGLGVQSRAIIVAPDCAPPAPPRPPIVLDACITEAGLWRRRLQAIPAVQISDYLDVVPTFEITTVSSEVSQVRLRIYANPSGLPLDQVDTNSWVSEQIISYVPMGTVLTIDGIHQRVYAEVGGGQPIAADHLLYGSKGTPATWPVLSCGIDYVISWDLPIDVPQLDSDLDVYLTTRY